MFVVDRFLDAYGGYNSFKECQERTENEEFTYIWDQAHFEPVPHP